jgi:single-strand DNA-binding protein
LWLGVTVFGGQAQACARHLKRGKQVAVTGRLEPDRWTGKDGIAHATVRVVAHSVEFLFPAGLSAAERDPEEPSLRADRARAGRPQTRAARAA